MSSYSTLPANQLQQDGANEKSIFTVDELAALHGFSRRTVIRLYQSEPGVLVLERPEIPYGKRGRKGKRKYRSFRIPHDVYLRVRRRLEVRSEM